jgi:hypothetical protein
MDDKVQHGDAQLVFPATSSHLSVEEDSIDSVAVLKLLAEPRVRTAMHKLTAGLTSKAKESTTKQGSLQAFFASNPAVMADATSILQSCSGYVTVGAHKHLGHLIHTVRR